MLGQVQGQSEAALGDPVADFCTFVDVALLLSSGLPDTAMLPLFKATLLAAGTQDTAAQKKGYKVLAHLARARPGVLREHLSEVCNLLINNKTAHAAAKRHRLACIKPVMLLLSSQDCPDVSSITAQLSSDGSSNASPAQAVMTPLVTEMVLCTKEVNAKTRSQAYDVLIDVARALHEALPPAISMDTGAASNVAASA